MLRLSGVSSLNLFFMLYRYFIIALAIAAALIGVQIPNYLTQYQQRLDAQLTEALVYYNEYQRIADKYFDGDMTALITLHETSENPVFQDEAVPLRQLVERVQRFQFEQSQLQQGYLQQLWFVATAASPELREHTWRMYSFNVPLNQRAVITGVVAALMLVLLLDILTGGCRMVIRRIRRKHRPTGRDLSL